MNQPLDKLVFHYHVHVIPRYAGDGIVLQHGAPYPPGESAKVASKTPHKTWLTRNHTESSISV